MTRDDEQSFNPFPGLRPFQTGEDHLFFGREEQTAALLTRLREHRFLAVVGASGSGKSSLVRAGLIPALYGGAMTRAGSHWEVAVFRPGGDPITNLARSLLGAELYDAEDPEALHRLRATLTRSRFGLAEAVRQSDAIDEMTNLFVLVDQFEELFRFRDRGTDHRDSATAFVKLLLTASEESDVRIFVALTMRSDYLGDSAQIPGLAQAINRGEFLIPRLTRDQKRDAIEKPVGVGGARIAPRLSQQMLNDVGDDPDQLPILQHALMRTWDAWVHDHAENEPVDLRHYEATGGMARALSKHADEVYTSLPDDAARECCERIFKALTERTSDNRGIRRPTRLAELEEIAGASREETLTILDAFRAPGVTFLMPGVSYELTDRTVIDLSHESLMRVWTRLRSWVEEEAQSARVYRRLSETAALWQSGEAGLYRDPDLGIATAWWEANAPSEAWASQYAGGFETAIEFLERSREAAAAEERAREEARQRELTQARTLAETQSRAATTFKRFAVSVAILAAVAIGLAIWAFGLWDRTEELFVESRHDQGKLWLNRARRQLAEKDFLGAKLLAAEAIGFEGFGRAEAPEAFREGHEPLLRGQSPEWEAARSVIELTPDYPLIWSSPSSRFKWDAHIHPFLSDDGATVACFDHGSVIYRFDARSGKELAPLRLEGSVADVLDYSGQTILTDTDSRIQLSDATTGELLPSAYLDRMQFNRTDRYDYLYSWRKDERKLRIFSMPKTLEEALAESARQIGETVELPDLESPVFAVALDQLYGAAVQDGVLHRIDFSGHEPGREVAVGVAEILGMFYSPDGRYLCVFPRLRQTENVSDRILVFDGMTHEPLYVKTLPEVKFHFGGAVPLVNTAICLTMGSRDPEEQRPPVSVVFDLKTREFGTMYPGWIEAAPTAGSLAVLGDFYSLRILDIATGTYRGRGVEEASFGRIIGARFHPGGRYFATFGSEGLRFRHSASGDVFARIAGTAITDLSFSPDGKRFITCEPFRKVSRIWNAEPLGSGSAPVEIEEIEGEASFARFSPAGDRLALLGPGPPPDLHLPKAGALRLVHLESEEDDSSSLDISPPEFGDRMTFSPDGAELALLVYSSSREDSARAPHPAEGHVFLTRIDLLTGHQSPRLELPVIVSDIAYSADGRWIGLAAERSASLLDRESGAMTILRSASVTGFDVVAFPPGGSLVAFGSSASGWISLFDTTTEELISRIPAHMKTVSSLEFSPDGKTLLSSSSGTATVKLWEVSPREETFSLGAGVFPSILYHPDGEHLVYQDVDGSESGGPIVLRFADIDTRHERFVPLSVPGPSAAMDLRFDREGGRFLFRVRSEPRSEVDRSIRIHDLGDGRLLGSLPHDVIAGQGVFEPQGSRIATVAGTRLHIWSSTYEPLESLSIVEPTHALYAIDWSPDGKFIACADELNVVIWNTETGARTRLDLPRVDRLRFQPEKGELLAAVDSRGITLVETSAWKVTLRSPGYAFPVENFSRWLPVLDWHPRGTALLFRDESGGIDVREPFAWRPLAHLEYRGLEEGQAVRGYLSAAFSPDGRRVVASAPGGESSSKYPSTIWDPWSGKSGPENVVYGRVEDPSRFASYLDVYAFKTREATGPGSYTADSNEASGEIVIPVIDGLFPSRGFEMRPVSTDTHIAILRTDDPGEEKTRRLFDSYLLARNWNAAAILLRELSPERAVQERRRFASALAAHARALLEAPGVEATHGADRLAVRWLKLAEEFAPDGERLREVRDLIEKRRSER